MACKSPEALERKRSYTREWKRRNRERVRQHNRDASARHRSRHPERVRARMLLNVAVRDGHIKRQPCAVCGAEAQAHHDDYSKPLEVRWLCPQHHREEHADRS